MGINITGVGGVPTGGGTFTGPVLFPNGTGTAPSLAFASDTDTGIYLAASDILNINCGGATSAQFTTNALRFASGWALSNNGSGNEYIKFVETSSAVNEVTITNAATGNGPTISATGGDTNVRLNLNGKGTATGGGVLIEPAAGLVGFYGTTPIVKQAGVAVTAAGIHAALVNLGLIAA